MRYDLYIAGPWFNPRQATHLDMVLRACADAGIKVFSPREESLVSEDASHEYRRAAFEANLKGIRECGHVLALLDWLLPEHIETRNVNLHGATPSPEQPGPWPITVTSPPVRVPDTGTVYEMGYAYGRVEVVGFTIFDHTHVNLMLAQGCAGVIQGYEDLARFLAPKRNRNNYDWKAAPQWDGKII